MSSRGFIKAVSAGLLVAVLGITFSAQTATPLGATALAQTCQATWQTVFKVADQNPQALIGGITVRAANDAWAVGMNQQNGQSAIYHWDGSKFSQVASPNVSNPAGIIQNQLSAVTELAANDAWAVGYQSTIITTTTDARVGPNQPLIQHWNGTGWQIVSSPAPTDGAELTSVSAVASDNVWAAGGGANKPVALHWDGKAWSQSNVPSPDNIPAVITKIDATAANDIWAAGYYFGGNDRGGLIWHWNGFNWAMTTIKPPVKPLPQGAYSELSFRSIAATSPKDVWAVGVTDDYRPSNNPRVGETIISLSSAIYHYDGADWKRVDAPNPGSGARLFDVTALDPNNAWAVGSYSNSNGQYSLLLYWDGSSWSQQDLPSSAVGAISNVVALAANDVWVLNGGQILRYAASCPSSTPTPQTANPTNRVDDPHDANVTYFALVGHTLRGVFRDYWQAHGGLAQFGYPLTEEYSEINSTDNKTYVVQYFERNRFEYHPENKAPYNVLLGLLGRTITIDRKGEAPFQPLATPPSSGRYYPATKHTIAPQFTAYWDAHGGLAVYGYPISEAFTETSPTNGKAYLVQYFERNRFEYHPENSDPYNILLGLLGTQVLKQKGWLK